MAPTAHQRLAEAEAAYHRVSIGGAVVEVTDSSGEKVRYSPANASRLWDYILRLREETGGARRVSAPMRPMVL